MNLVEEIRRLVFEAYCEGAEDLKDCNITESVCRRSFNDSLVKETLEDFISKNQDIFIWES